MFVQVLTIFFALFVISFCFHGKVYGESFLSDLPLWDGVYVRTVDGSWIKLEGTKIKRNSTPYWIEYRVPKENIDTIFRLDYRNFRGFLIKGINFVENYKKSPKTLKLVRLVDNGVIVTKNRTLEEAVRIWRNSVGYEFRTGSGYEYKAQELKLPPFDKEFQCVLTESYYYCEPKNRKLFYENLYKFTHLNEKKEDSVDVISKFIGTKEIYVEDHGCFLVGIYVQGFEDNIICLTGKPEE